MIDQRITNYPLVADRTDEQFYEDIEAWVTHGANTVADEMNTMADEINSTAETINQKEQSASNSATVATQKAQEATAATALLEDGVIDDVNIATNKTYSNSKVNELVRGYKNYLKNTGFLVWEDGTDFNDVMYDSYTADCWKARRASNDAGMRVYKSSVRTAPGSLYSMAINRTNSLTSEMRVMQQIETIDCIDLQGRKIVIPIVHSQKSGASWSSLKAILTYSTTDNESLGVFGGTLIDEIELTLTNDGTWHIDLLTVTIPYSARVVSLILSATPTGSTFTDDFWYINKTQLDIENARALYYPTYNEDLSDCKRYFQKAAFKVGGLSTSSGQKVALVYFDQMRIVPDITSYDISGNVNYISTYSLGGVRTDNVAADGFIIVLGSLNNHIVVIKTTAESGLAGYLKLDARL